MRTEITQRLKLGDLVVACRVPPDDDNQTIYVGELNPNGSAPEWALWPRPLGQAGDRLGKILEVPEDQQERTWRANLCERHWSLPPARVRARSLIVTAMGMTLGTTGERSMLPITRWVLLGVRVRAAFEGAVRELARDNLSTPILTFTEGVDCEVVSWRPDTDTTRRPWRIMTMPHPSGRNRAWNAPGARDRVRRVFRDQLVSP